MARLEADHGNLRAALSWLAETTHTTQLSELVTNLEWFWYLGAHAAEGLGWINRVLALQPDGASEDRMKLLLGAGSLALQLQDGSAVTYIEQGRVLAQRARAVAWEARATSELGIAAEDAGEYATAEELFTGAAALWPHVDDPWHGPANDYHLGIVFLGQGDHVRATTLLDAAMTAATEMGDMLVPVWSLSYLAFIAYDQEDLGRVITLFRQMRLLESRSGMLLRKWRGIKESATIIATILGESTAAAQLLGAAAADAHDVPHAMPERLYVRRMELAARERLGNDAYRTAWEIGRRMSRADLEAEMDRLVAVAQQSRARSTAGPDPSRLTAREREVLRLLVDGRSNREIAEALFISHRTATTHVANILAKFEVDTRAAAVTYAFQHDLM